MYSTNGSALVAQTVQNLLATHKTQVQSLGREDPLEKEMATHFNILAWRIPWNEEPGGLQSMGLQRVTSVPLLSFIVFLNYFSESCLSQLKVDIVMVSAS